MLDLPDPEFRDPKVFWQDNPGDDDYWVMAAVRAVSRQVEFYRSDDLKDWDLLSSFGPANAVGGVWEEDGELWSPDGELLVQSRQLALVREPAA